MTTKVVIFYITVMTLIAKRLVISCSLSIQDYALFTRIEWGDSTINIIQNSCIKIENSITKIHYSTNTKNVEISNGSNSNFSHFIISFLASQYTPSVYFANDIILYINLLFSTSLLADT